MTEKFLTVQEATLKYNLNPSKVTLAIKKAAFNGLYKVIFRKRTRIYFRQDFFETWLKTNDVTGLSDPRFSGRPKKEEEKPKGPRGGRRKSTKIFWSF